MVVLVVLVVIMISMSVLIPLCSCGISLPACLSSIQYKAVHSILLVEPAFLAGSRIHRGR